MQRTAISILSFFVIMPSMAAVSLPSVNTGSVGVSARDAFGVSRPAPVVSTAQKRLVARPAVKNSEVLIQDTFADSAISDVSVEPRVAVAAPVAEQQLISGGDILAPRRPNGDLWARSDAPLRLPTPEEFSVVRPASVLLPEEDINASFLSPVELAATARAADVLPAVRDVKTVSAVQSVPADVMPQRAKLDNQIALLNELQRRAEKSVSDNASAQVPATVVARAATPDVKTVDVIVPQQQAQDITLSRMMVPATRDVIVRSVEKNASPSIAAVREDMSSMTPSQLRKAFRKTFLSENKHLSTYQIDDAFDVASDMSVETVGFTSSRDLSESGGIRPLEIKIKFRNEDSALSRDNYNLLTEYAGIVLSNPTRAIQVSIPADATKNSDDKKLAARRLAIVEQVLRDTGVSEHRIMPVLSSRDEQGFVLRMISSEQYETMSQQRRDMFGDTIGSKSYKSMTW